MSFPNDCLGLLSGDPSTFNAQAYLGVYGKYAFTRMEGFNEIVEACVLAGCFKSEESALSALRSACTDAASDVPLAWRKAYPRGAWDKCHPDQVISAYNCKALLFDKACLVLRALEITCRRDSLPMLHGLDPYRFITLHAAIYVLRGIEKWNRLRVEFPHRMKACEIKLIDDLKQKLLTSDPRDPKLATDQMAESFLSQAMSGYPMTWKNASIIADAFNEPVFGATRRASEVPGADCLINPISVAISEGRADGGRRVSNKHCNQSEGAFVSLSRTMRETLDECLEGGVRKAARP
jgi:hypothetical protein